MYAHIIGPGRHCSSNSHAAAVIRDKRRGPETPAAAGLRDCQATATATATATAIAKLNNAHNCQIQLIKCVELYKNIAYISARNCLKCSSNANNMLIPRLAGENGAAKATTVGRAV